jgi:hypothetical protein
MTAFNQALGQGIRNAGNASSVQGFATNLVSGAVKEIPLVGGLASSLVEGLFGGNDAPTPQGGNMYDGLQKPGAAPLSASGIAANDAQVFVDMANQYGVYVQDVNTILEFNQGYSRNTWMDVVNYYRAHNDQFGYDLDAYNQKYPSKRILRNSRVLSPIEPASTYYLSGSTATLPIVPAPNQTGTNQPDTADTNKTLTIGLIGGGVLAVVIILILVLKKKA